jgi:hypothetical protein
MNEIKQEFVTKDQLLIQSYETLTLFFLISIVVLIYTIIKSFKEDGAQEGFRTILENTPLWFLLFFSFMMFTVPPVSPQDKIASAILVVAFGVCRIAKHLAKNKN